MIGIMDSPTTAKVLSGRRHRFDCSKALVAGNARELEIPSGISAALQWLEMLDPPVIIAPDARSGRVLLTYVLNNEESRTRTPKMIRPTLLNGDRLLQYGWIFDDKQPDAVAHAKAVAEASRHVRALGWGIDLAIGCGELLDGLPAAAGRRVEYRPCTATNLDGGLGLRVPQCRSLQSLCDQYTGLLRRYESPGITDLEPGGAIYGTWSYIARAARPCVVFALRASSDDSYRYPHAKLIHIAGMTRCAAISAMKDCPPEDLKIEDTAAWIESFVAGHRQETAERHDQFSYIPLPSIGHEHADAMIRRVMITAPFGHEAQLRHLADQLEGQQLKPEDGSEGPVLDRLLLDGVTRRYLETSRVWASVTPVILPGHDDHKLEKTVRLIKRAFLQSGIDQSCEFTWGPLPNFKHCLAAYKYDRGGRPAGYQRPKHLESLTAVHMRVTFEHPVADPVSIGAGRHCGFGIFAATP
jgi:CRISPR-associated protein Csb2